MKIQEVILRAVAKKITWKQARDHRDSANESCGRRKQHYQEFG